MVTPRRRRRPSPSPKPRAIRVKGKALWKRRALNAAIGVFILVNFILLVSLVRHWAIKRQNRVVNALDNPVQLEVLNGCGVPGMADKFAVYLRDKGFDVVKTSNYRSFGVAQTLVIDRKGDLGRSRRAVKTLGIAEEQLIQESHESYVFDATVVIGTDYRLLPCWREVDHP
jgi:hypothetical protein